MLLSLLIAFALAPHDTLSAAIASASAKQTEVLERVATPFTSIPQEDTDKLQNQKSLSSRIPNLLMPEYGAAMTSTIYLRGFGSRMDNPVIGLYIDDIPVLDKNSYDTQWMDILRADFLRGPQGTLFGRNSQVGVLALQTRTPALFQGGDATLEYGNAGNILVKGSYYKGKVGATIAWRHSDGFFVNEHDGKRCDGFDGVSARFRYVKPLSANLLLDNITSVSWLSQGGFAYHAADQPVSHNDPCGYTRINALEGLKFRYAHEKFSLHSVTSLQLLFDHMVMDQDFTQDSVFTLEQIQRSGAVTQEFIFRPVSPVDWWESQTGVFAFFRYNRMSAPVVFGPDGISDLILANANAHIPPSIGALAFDGDHLPISSEFNLSGQGVALYHASDFILGKWRLTAGARLDYEGGRMGYDSRASLRWAIRPSMAESHPLETVYKGITPLSFWKLLPKVSALYDAGSLKVYASVAEGYKAGGFNTQLFSDILQGKLSTDLMEAMGVYIDAMGQTTAEQTVYKPETSLDFEAGLRYARDWFRGSVSAFWISCRDQQITVFPPGKKTGRMMANAGKSHSAGVEAEFSCNWTNFSLDGSYGYTYAVFDQYSDGNYDYSGRRIPYAPEQTFWLRATFAVGKWAISADGSGYGRIWWNEDNSLCQGAKAFLGAEISFDASFASIYLRGRNLTGTSHDTFYFKSVGREFYQQGLPAQYLLGIKIKI